MPVTQEMMLSLRYEGADYRTSCLCRQLFGKILHKSIGEA